MNKKSNDDALIESLIEYAILRLRNFGFINVNKDNILVDEVYSYYFFRIMNDRLDEQIIKDRITKVLKGRKKKSIFHLHNFK